MQLQEQYRPKSLDDVVGQDKAVKQIRTILKRGWGGRAWYIIGPSGSGKTTIAHILAEMGADDFNQQELDSTKLTPTAVQQCEGEWRFTGVACGRGLSYTINEAHALRSDTIQQLLTALDPVPSYVAFIFTTTPSGQKVMFDDDQTSDVGALMSRCHVITLESGPEVIRAFGKRAFEIAMVEGLNEANLPEAAFVAAAGACKGNMRALLQLVESGSVGSVARTALDAELRVLSRSSPRRVEIETVLQAL
jgi:replication-associated recombination protein RarA